MKILIYKKSNGQRPLDKFLKSIDKEMKADVYAAIDNLKEKGNKLRFPYSRYLQDGIFELRIISSNGISRVLYFFYLKDCAVITHGFIKKTQKTHKLEIEKANKYKKDFINKNNDKVGD